MTPRAFQLKTRELNSFILEESIKEYLRAGGKIEELDPTDPRRRKYEADEVEEEFTKEESEAALKAAEEYAEEIARSGNALQFLKNEPGKVVK